MSNNKQFTSFDTTIGILQKTFDFRVTLLQGVRHESKKNMQFSRNIYHLREKKIKKNNVNMNSKMNSKMNSNYLADWALIVLCIKLVHIELHSAKFSLVSLNIF